MWRTMGWGEFRSRISHMNAVRSGTLGADPGRWNDPVTKSNFDELDEKRRKLRGR